MFNTLEKTWKNVLKAELEQSYLKDIQNFISSEQAKGETIYPTKDQIFNAFKLCPFDQVKTVILGQDPYHGTGQAHGLAFSVKSGIRIPPSLRNIYKELQTEYTDFRPPKNGDLSSWAKQGVLLLNATLTVSANSAGSHQSKGWEPFTDKVIETLSARCQHLVFILWGNYAKQKCNLIDEEKHLIIESAHPSPLAAYQGFFGSKPFSRTNEYLSLHNKETINWQSVCFDSQQSLF